MGRGRHRIRTLVMPRLARDLWLFLHEYFFLKLLAKTSKIFSFEPTDTSHGEQVQPHPRARMAIETFSKRLCDFFHLVHCDPKSLRLGLRWIGKNSSDPRIVVSQVALSQHRHQDSKFFPVRFHRPFFVEFDVLPGLG